MKKAISIFSGGLDCTVATSVFSKSHKIHAITFNYGQKAFKRELKASKEICKKMDWTHEVIDLPWLANISNSSLNTNEKIPELSAEDLDNLKISQESASSVWVPARNTVFTSIALSYAESIGASSIIVGWNGEEGATFPDNSKGYMKKFNELIKEGSPENIRIEAPLIDLDKEEIVKLGVEYDAPMELSYSCYKGKKKQCGICESCMRRKRAFKNLGIKDKSEYEN
ncbi:7-cyano-7-deazaguanine synthase [Methanobrevibacter gottschalkii]|uniref:7-cyano-7-deazaguanine synthase n=2 Tax=Methanobrevibacter gottschalkii TaxID=190974 RepID=A0A3N5B624_9EURY|nr:MULTISPECIES: 7-cyano-7-deazaguanine synthase QueC [Methanobrevibacter]MCQ2971207.1 7-cyano-7-deazaguanine synthase QueC [archaeon]OEC97569.1 7-cyano-7-deazaguanine synthase QueC [Methanobrevibacter sp. A27]RPF52539.1 7-cyano-7-deazaguanine synthase [Methanobrevibacter gottschalkii DSM 11977]SEL18892.1 7-cyano-7-deazaguanine synthase [Methanobrevibacter gottschalkii]